MQAIRTKIAGLGGRARARTLSPERRREIASWARFIRKQKEHGQVTATEQKRRIILLVRAENPDLAAFLKAVSGVPLKYSERISQALSDEDKQLIEKKWIEVQAKR